MTLNQGRKKEKFEYKPFSWEKPIEQEILDFVKYMAKEMDKMANRKGNCWFKKDRKEAENYAAAYRIVENHILQEILIRGPRYKWQKKRLLNMTKIKNMLTTCKLHDNTLPMKALLKEFDEVYDYLLDDTKARIKSFIRRVYHQGENDILIKQSSALSELANLKDRYPQTKYSINQLLKIFDDFFLKD